MADDVCFIRSMKTDAINHEPANQLVYTGSMQNGKGLDGLVALLRPRHAQ
jgi:hypothetical protein